jgi:hypothetical protein
MCDYSRQSLGGAAGYNPAGHMWVESHYLTEHVHMCDYSRQSLGGAADHNPDGHTCWTNQQAGSTSALASERRHIGLALDTIASSSDATHKQIDQEQSACHTDNTYFETQKLLSVMIIAIIYNIQFFLSNL